MLDRLWKHKWPALALLAIWLVFECWISWAAFCSQAKQYGGNYQPPKEDGCIFRGPVASLWRGALQWWDHTFDHADAYVALFTCVLVVATTALWWSTRKLWQAGDRQIEISEQLASAASAANERTREIERAYISGGGAPEGVRQTFKLLDGREVEVRTAETGRFQLAVNNHGKTPAEFLEYGVGWCEADSIPIFPVYVWTPWRDRYGPGTQSRVFAAVVIPPELKRPAIYGRYRYRDIFGNLHSDGFIQEGPAPLLASQPFTISDPEWDLPPRAQWQSLIAPAVGRA